MLGSPKVLAVAVFVSGAVQVVAENSPQAVQLNMVKVEGQATAGLDELITAEQLENIQAQDLSDIFRNNPQVSVGGPLGLGQKIYLRNIGEDMLNISVDGAEQAGAVFHHSGRVAIEPELLKQVEIEAGAGSATAGAGALGGTIRFTTKDPLDLLNPGEKAGVLLKSGYFSNGSSTKNSATVFAGDEQLSAMASVIAANFNDVKDGNGDEMAGTGSDQNLGYAKLVSRFAQSHKVSLSYEALKESGDILYRPEWKPGPKNPLSDTTAKRDTAIANYTFDSASPLIAFSVNAYQTKSNQKRAIDGFDYEGYIQTTGGRIQNISVIGSHQLVYGIDLRNDQSLLQESQYLSRAGELVTTPEIDEQGRVRGAFLQDIMHVTDDLTVTTGIRYDDYYLKDAAGQKLEDDGYSPNLSANYVLGGGFSVSAGYAQAIRGVTVTDSFKLGSSFNSPALKAEKVDNTELGVEFNGDNLAVAMGAYQAVIKDAIAGDLPWSKEYINHKDDIKTTGFYLNASVTLDKLLLTAALNSADSKQDGEKVSRYVYSSSGVSVGDTLILNADYQLNASLQAGWNMEAVNDVNDIKLDLGGDKIATDKPGYAVHDIYLRWQPLHDTLTLNIAVKNLFDRQYMSHASLEDFSHNAGWENISGLPEAGRELRLSAALRF
ncbi:TonB-dependent receptor domain-containing protein [Bacterioplanoides pacificum]|uniref:TonB-dependent receptor domain-containing protein n=1 Tax=Bacterioplanoides pacificum TaxID=1171596 RepID=A0ABV7VN74_9GAMM